LQPFAIGDFQVARIVERDGPFGPLNGLVPDANEEDLRPHYDWLTPNYLDPNSFWVFMSVNSYLIRTPHHTILIDTCGGNHKERPNSAVFHQKETPWLENLHAAGVGVEDIDFVMCTHLHIDHTGWNTKLENGRWVPTFPNARYLFDKTELDYWEAEAPNSDGDEKYVYNDSVLPVVESGQMDLVANDYEFETGLTLESLPGHTPGHRGVNAASGGDKALFTADCLHHPSQIVFPEWNSG
jgi:glyoxylase-like metal-dependent hydrolase (beta-lactamase superfamily II)